MKDMALVIFFCPATLKEKVALQKSEARREIDSLNQRKTVQNIVG